MKYKFWAQPKTKNKMLSLLLEEFVSADGKERSIYIHILLKNILIRVKA